MNNKINIKKETVFDVVDFYIGMEVRRLRSKHESENEKSRQNDVQFLEQVIGYIKKNLK